MKVNDSVIVISKVCCKKHKSAQGIIIQELNSKSKYRMFLVKFETGDMARFYEYSLKLLT